MNYIITLGSWGRSDNASVHSALDPAEARSDFDEAFQQQGRESAGHTSTI
jgi:hypothetical protein